MKSVSPSVTPRAARDDTRNRETLVYFGGMKYQMAATASAAPNSPAVSASNQRLRSACPSVAALGIDDSAGGKTEPMPSAAVTRTTGMGAGTLAREPWSETAPDPPP